MLVVKVEVWPGGNADRAFEISRIGIANTSNLADISNYEMTALMEMDGAEHVLRSEINAHERSLGWAPLVKRAMTSLYLAERLAHGVPYDDPVAEHLRKDRDV
jgi:hypothetical protein